MKLNYFITWFTIKPPMFLDFRKEWEAQYPFFTGTFCPDLWAVMMKGC